MKPKILAIIPARGGSKGVPRKNIRELAGKPLIAWTIEEAKKSKYISKLILTSEDDEIIEVAKKYGCEVPFKRPKELAQDDTPGIMPILHGIETCPGYDYVLLLQPTSPLRNSEDIDSFIEFFLANDASACVSVCKTKESPYWMYHLNETENKLLPLIESNSSYYRRQELPVSYILNGALYIAKNDWLKENQTFLSDETIGYIMPTERSIDIDNLLDFQLCELMLVNK